MRQNTKKVMLEVMNEINQSELFKTHKITCNVMGCRNKPRHEFKRTNCDRSVWSCNKHEEDYIDHKWFEKVQE